MLLSMRNVKFVIKMHWFTMFIPAVCVLFLVRVRWTLGARLRWVDANSLDQPANTVVSHRLRPRPLAVFAG